MARRHSQEAIFRMITVRVALEFFAGGSLLINYTYFQEAWIVTTGRLGPRTMTTSIQSRLSLARSRITFLMSYLVTSTIQQFLLGNSLMIRDAIRHSARLRHAARIPLRIGSLIYVSCFDKHTSAVQS